MDNADTSPNGYHRPEGPEVRQTHQKPQGIDAADVRLIARSGLFDASFYGKASQRVDLSEDGLIEHYLQNWSTHFIEPSSHFDGRRYQDLYLNGNIELPPLLHFLMHGMFDGLNPWSEASVCEWQRPFSEDPRLATDSLSRDEASWPTLRSGDVIHIHVHSKSHIVFHEFRQLLTTAFRCLDINAVHADENVKDDPVLRIIIAPHDFFFLDQQSNDSLANRVGLSSCVLFNTEQIHSVWFGKAFQYLKTARCVVDINLQTAVCLKQLGISSQFLPLGFVSGYPLFSEGLPLGPEFRDLVTSDSGCNSGGRPIDLLWIGSHAKRRQRFLDESSPQFEKLNSFIRLVKVRGALSADNPDAISSMSFAALAQRSKIILNVHHFDVPYFEWQRLVHFGLFQQACVVTERVSGVDGLLAGEHYFEADWHQIPELVNWLLCVVQGIQARKSVAKQGKKKALQQFQLVQTLKDLFSVTQLLS